MSAVEVAVQIAWPELGHASQAGPMATAVSPRPASLPPSPSPEPDHGPSSSKSSRAGSKPPSRMERRFKCLYEGCDKAYFKPSRLAEHELTHTGERPHKCPECSQAYLRASHLHAHMRMHLPQDARPFSCDRPGCSATFWTATHHRRHLEMHDKEEVHGCEQCEQTFSKPHLLREHVAFAHMPEGTKPFICTHEGCGKSFTMKAKLKAHEKTHDPTRYTCSHPSHGTELPSFPVWSALQAHIHAAHPPTCPHAECDGRTFKSTLHLKSHLKTHAEREVDRALVDGAGAGEAVDQPPIILDGLSRRAKRKRLSEVVEDGKSPKLRRLSTGEAGKDWACDHEGCDKSFKTRFAMETHKRAIHLKVRDHICPVDGCGKAYTVKSTLQRHIESHSRPTTPGGSSRTASVGGALTGNVRELRRFGCPAHALGHFLAAHRSTDLGEDEIAAKAPDPVQLGVDGPGQSTAELVIDPVLLTESPVQPIAKEQAPSSVAVKSEPDDMQSHPSADVVSGPGHENTCWMRFWRVYDVRRHLRAEHGVDLQDMEVRRLLLHTGQTGE
ncbi:hypothetical protein IAU60_006728 [Kwoniella sp. DSM 27419]